MAALVREHPDNVYVPLGDCPRCHATTFIDGTPDDLRVRPHAIQDKTQRASILAAAAKAGRRVYEYPVCPGSSRQPVEGTVSFPTVWFCR